MEKGKQLSYEMQELNSTQEFLEAVLLTTIYLKQTKAEDIKEGVANDYNFLFSQDLVETGKDIARKEREDLKKYTDIGFIKLFAEDLMKGVHDGQENYYVKKSQKMKPVISTYDVRYKFWLKEDNSGENMVVILERERTEEQQWKITEIFRFKSVKELTEEQKDMFEDVFLKTKAEKDEYLEKEENFTKSFMMLVTFALIVLLIAVFVTNH